MDALKDWHICCIEAPGGVYHEIQVRQIGEVADDHEGKKEKEFLW